MLRLLIFPPRLYACTTTRRRQLLRRLRAVTLALVSPLLLAGCSLLGGGEQSFGSDGVVATLHGEKLIIENRRSQEVWTFVIGRKIQAQTNWVVGVGEEGEGPSPGERKTVDLEEVSMIDDIAESDETEEAINVHWWEAVTEDGERVPGPVSTFTVDL